MTCCTDEVLCTTWATTQKGFIENSTRKGLKCDARARIENNLKCARQPKTRIRSNTEIPPLGLGFRVKNSSSIAVADKYEFLK